MALYSTSNAINNLSSVKKKRTEKFEEENYSDYEYNSFLHYKQNGGQALSLETWKGKDVKWLWSDRRNRNDRYKLAMQLIIKSPLLYVDRLKPFEQIADFYYQTQRFLNFRKHETRWIKGAFYLVKFLADVYHNWKVINYASENTYWSEFDLRNLKKLLSALNRAIVNYAIVQFQRLFFGDKRYPQEGLEAWKFDKQFIIGEQIVIAFSIYRDFSIDNPRALALENEIFNQEGIFSSISLLLYIPVFPDQYNSDLTQLSTRFGEKARTLIPLAMLYPNQYFYNDVKTTNGINDFSISDEKFAKTLKRGEQKFVTKAYQDDDYQIYRAYLKANSIIMKTFYR